MEPRQIIRSGITASAIVHLSFLLLVIFFTEVHPFGSTPTEPIAVDLVTPKEVQQQTPETPSKPIPPPIPPSPIPPSPDASDASSRSAASSSAPAAASSSPAAPSSPPAAAPPPPAAAQQATTSPPKQAAASPLPAAQPRGSMMPATPPPAYVPAQPDLSVKYHVMLGLPQDAPGDGFDAAAVQAADIASSPVAEFRRHLKTCSTLPKSIAASEKIAIKLRVLMTPDGRLAAPPIPIEGSASTKAVALMESAVSALQACQPYAMLPADKYSEWKVLDLNFTPQDFTGAS